MENLKQAEGKEFAADSMPGTKKPAAKAGATAAAAPAKKRYVSPCDFLHTTHCTRSCIDGCVLFCYVCSNFASAALFDQLSAMVKADSTIAGKVGAIFVYKLSA